MAWQARRSQGPRVVGVQILGDEVLKKKLESFKQSTVSKFARAASRKAMKPVTADIKAGAPKQSGLLKKIIGVKQKTYKRSGTVVTVSGPRTGMKQTVTVRVERAPKPVKPRKKALSAARAALEARAEQLRAPRKRFALRKVLRDPVKYAHLVEYGTKPHKLGKGSKLRRSRRKDDLMQGGQRGGSHPGSRAQPFINPAYVKNQYKTQRIYREEMWAEIRKHAAKRHSPNPATAAAKVA